MAMTFYFCSVFLVSGMNLDEYFKISPKENG